MELRHLRYFIAVAEEGSFSLAAERRLHTAQPSLSRQIRDLELEVGAELLARGPRGVELTAAGRVFLDHARIALLQVEAAGEAARRAAQPAKTSFALGFLTGYELDWLPPVMDILRDELPTAEIVIYSQQSPDLAAGLVRGKIDAAFLRPEKGTPNLAYRLLRKEPLIAVMAADHPLATRESIRPRDIANETFIGFPQTTGPVLRDVVDRYARDNGIDLTPDYGAENLSMAFSLVISVGGVTLLPLYAQKLLPPSVISRPMQGAPPMIDLVLGYNENNTSRLLKALLTKMEDLKFRVSRNHAA